MGAAALEVRADMACKACVALAVPLELTQMLLRGGMKASSDILQCGFKNEQNHLPGRLKLSLKKGNKSSPVKLVH